MNKSILTQIRTVVAVTWLAFGLLTAFGQAPVITSFSQNGLLVCSNVQTGSSASIEWASSVLGPWSNNWLGLEAVTPDSNGTIQVSVPMFYRVKGVPLQTNSTPFGMALIPAGSFAMGDTFGEGGTQELPVHTVNLSAFNMDAAEITKAFWDEIYEWAVTHGYLFDAGEQGKAANHPVTYVSWYDAVKWCNARSEKEGRTPAYYINAAQSVVYRSGNMTLDNAWVKWKAGYRLPTEAEWEKAARGGLAGKRFPWGDNISQSQANYYSDTSNSYDISPTRGFHPNYNDGTQPYTSPVGSFSANGYGLYDMSGNVSEWCWDRWWDGRYYSISPATDPQGSTMGNMRTIRGGSWQENARSSRNAYRAYGVEGWYPVGQAQIGFRCVLPVAQ